MSSVRRHPVTEGELLLWADGELYGDESRRLDSHVSDCPDCRAKLEDCEGVLRAFAQIHDNLNSSPVPPLPNRWEPLETRIEGWENRRTMGNLLGRSRGLSRPRYALAGTLALVLALVAIFLQPWQETVSANELLNRARMAQSESLRVVPGSVMHLTLQIRRQSAIRDQNASLSYESWQDTSGRFFRETSSSGTIVAELQRIYQANGLDWRSPLSAAAYERWRSSLEKHDSVVHADRNRLILTTLADGQPFGDAITKAQLIVRSTDWRPVTARLWVRDLEYEITELNFAATLDSQREPSFEIPESPLAAAAPAVSAQKTRVARSSQILTNNAPSTSFPDLFESADTARDISSAVPESGSFPDSPGLTANLSLEHSSNSGATISAPTANRPPSTGESAPLPAGPAPRPDLVITFTARAGKPRELLAETNFPVVVAPTRLPVAVRVSEHRNRVNTESLKELARKLGFKRKKNEPVEPAKPGG
jgi:hypothetical protein